MPHSVGALIFNDCMEGLLNGRTFYLASMTDMYQKIFPICLSTRYKREEKNTKR